MAKRLNLSRYWFGGNHIIGDIQMLPVQGLADATNIKLSEVSSVLGYGSIQTIPTVCQAITINRWSAFRPYNPNVGSYGYDYNTSTRQLFRPPLDASNGYRLGDFAGYNHQAIKSEIVDETGFTGNGTYTISDLTNNTFTLKFQMGEISPADIMPAVTHLYIVNDANVFDGIKIVGSAALSIHNTQYTVSFTIPNPSFNPTNPSNGQSHYFTVWFGDSNVLSSANKIKWYLPNEIENLIELIYQTYFNYVISYHNFNSGDYFNLELVTDEFIGGRPEQSTSTFNINTNMVSGGQEEYIDIKASINGGATYVTAKTIPMVEQWNNPIVIDWQQVFGGDLLTQQGSTYTIRVEYRYETGGIGGM